MLITDSSSPTVERRFQVASHYSNWLYDRDSCQILLPKPHLGVTDRLVSPDIYSLLTDCHVRVSTTADISADGGIPLVTRLYLYYLRARLYSLSIPCWVTLLFRLLGIFRNLTSTRDILPCQLMLLSPLSINTSGKKVTGRVNSKGFV